MTPLLRLALLVLAVAATSCVQPLTFCTVEGTQDLIYAREECPAACFVDADGDGYGSTFHELAEGEECSRENGLTNREGDCADDDDNRFPSNPEVCDGRDNDCLPLAEHTEDQSGEPDFDTESEEEQGEGTMIFSCTPPAAFSEEEGGGALPADEIRFFLRGGGHINGSPVDARNFEVQVAGGEDLRGLLKFRAVVSPGVAQDVYGAAVGSWAVEHSRSFHPVFGDTGGPVMEEIAPGYFDFEVEVGTTLDLTAPEYDGDAEESANLYQLTLAASGWLGESDHVASLTDVFYCCEPGDLDCSCEAVFADTWDPFDPPDGPGPVEELPPPADLADLDALDLAACRSYGAARVPILFRSIGPNNASCSFEDDGPCVPLVEGFQIGCSFVSIVVEDD